MIKCRHLIFLMFLAFNFLFLNNLINVNNYQDEKELSISNINQEDSWSRIIRNMGWGGSSWDRPNLHILNDSIVVAGYKEDTIHVDRYHENGTLEWEFRHEVYLNLYHYIFKSLIDHENNIIIVASVLDNQVLKPFFLKVDQNGTMLISKFMIELFERDIMFIASDSCNFIYVTGLNYINYTYYLAKLDYNGDFVYLKELNGSGYPKLYVDKFDNVFVGRSWSLYKFNTTGSLLWEVGSYQYLNSENPQNIFAVCNIDDDSYFVKLNSSGEIINKTKIISGTIDYLYESAYSQNYTYLFYYDYDKEEKFILKYDNDCNLKWNILNPLLHLGIVFLSILMKIFSLHTVLMKTIFIKQRILRFLN